MAKRKKRQSGVNVSAPPSSTLYSVDGNATNGNGVAEPNGSIKGDAAVEDEISVDDALWSYGRWAVLIAGTALRFLELTLKPFHHDEGVNGFFLTTLFRDGVYKYDPTNYHGPSLYYFALISSWIFGLDDLAVRLVVAVFGILTVAFVFSLRRHLGTIGTLTAAAFVAVSPGLTFFSRYFIHEILLVFFTFAAAVCVLKFIEGDRVGKAASAAMALTIFVCLLPAGLQAAATAATADDRSALYVARFVAVIASGAIAVFVTQHLHSWDGGRPIYLFLAAASASMTFTTKETWFISLGTMLIAGGCVAAWLRVTGPPDSGAANKRTGFLIVAAGLIAACVYFVSDISSGINWLLDNYLLGPDRQEQVLVFFGIGSLLIVAAETARRYLVYVWKRPRIAENLTEPQQISFKRLRARLNESGNAAGLIFLSLIVFTAVAVVFFTSFLTNEKGVSDAFEAYNVWTKTGSKDHAQNGTWAYLKWTIGVESPILILAVLGTILAFWKAKHRFAMFSGLWAFGLFAAYTIIPYKTPWIAINFVLPMALAAGYAVNELAEGEKWWEHTAAKVLGALGLTICLFQCIELNFFRYDDERRPYIYVHSKRSMNEMIDKIGEISRKAKLGDKASIIVTSPENWPLPWSLNQYKGALIYGTVVKTPNTEFVIGSKAQRTDLDRDYSATHAVVGTYGLRPGVDLLLYVRNDLIN